MLQNVQLSFHQEMLELLPDGVVWACPVFDKHNNITDFTIEFSNKAADKVVGHPLGSLIGLFILKHQIPAAETCQANFENFLKVYHSGMDTDFTFLSPYTNMVVETTRRKFRHGVLSSVRDRVALRVAEQNERSSKKILNSIVNHSPSGIVVYDAVRDKQNKIVDFRIRHYNKKANELTGYTDLQRENNSLKIVLKDLEIEDAFSHYVDVVDNNVVFNIERYFPKVKRWVAFSAVKLDDSFLAILTDVTEFKLNAQKLQEHFQFTEQVLEASLNGILVFEAIRINDKIVDFTIVTANKMVAQLLGHTPEEMIGKNVSALYPENMTNGIHNIFSSVVTTGVSERHMEVYYNTENIKDTWFEYSAVRLGPNNLVVTFQDITEQKRAALELQHSKDRFAEVFNASQSGMFTFAAVKNESGEVVDFRFVITNPTFANYVGQTPEILQGELGSTWFPGYMHNGVFDMYKHTYLTGKTNRIDIHYNVDQHDIFLDLMSTKVGDEVLVTFTDYTQLKRTQFDLERSVEELKRSNTNLQEFAYAASHDLKEPIRKINIFADKLKGKFKALLDAEGIRTFGKLEAATERMRSLVDDLLNYSRVTLNSENHEEVNLNVLLREVLEDLEIEIEEKNATVHASELPMIKGRSRQFHQLFQNLLSNSLKYTKPDTAPEIRINYELVSGENVQLNLSIDERRQSFHQIQFSDNGIGFEQRDAEKIFLVFQRLHGTSQYKGTGVGLSIARKVVQNHKGFIYANSELNEGATFTVLLPA